MSVGDGEKIIKIKLRGYSNLKNNNKDGYGLVNEIGEKNVYLYKYINEKEEKKQYGVENLTEIDILSKIKHPNIIQKINLLTKYNCDIKGQAIILPLADRTLWDIIIDNKMSIEMKLQIIYKIARGLECLHNHHILHLNLKASNIIIGENNQPQIIDFSMSMIVDNPSVGKLDTITRVTKDYRAPEILTSDKIYNSAVDVWSFGILLLYFLTGKPIYNVDLNQISDDDFVQLIKVIFTDEQFFDKLSYDIKSEYRDDCKDLLKKILNFNPTTRLSAKEIVNHKLFSHIAEIDAPCEISHDTINYDYASDQRDIIKLIVHWVKEIYLEYSSEILFLAVDLFNRVSAFYKQDTPFDRMTVAATCLWMSSKLLNINLLPVDIYVDTIKKLISDITTESILYKELEIIHLLDGFLFSSNLYNQCQTINHLTSSFHNIIMSRDSTLYGRTDTPRWITHLHIFHPEDLTNSAKLLTIKDLLAD